MTPEQKARISARLAAGLTATSALVSLLMDIPMDEDTPLPLRRMAIKTIIILVTALAAYWHDLRAYYAPSPNGEPVIAQNVSTTATRTPEGVTTVEQTVQTTTDPEAGK